LAVIFVLVNLSLEVNYPRSRTTGLNCAAGKDGIFAEHIFMLIQ